MVKHLYICLTLGTRTRGESHVERGGKESLTYFFPSTGDPGVTCAFCGLARLGNSRALVSVTEILPDPTGAFEPAVNVSDLNSDSTGDRALVKKTHIDMRGRQLHGKSVCDMFVLVFLIQEQLQGNNVI